MFDNFSLFYKACSFLLFKGFSYEIWHYFGDIDTLPLKVQLHLLVVQKETWQTENGDPKFITHQRLRLECNDEEKINSP